MKKSRLLGAVLTAIFSFISIQSHASVVEYDSKSAFVASVGGYLVTQDWSTYPANTLLDGQLVDGITYNSTSSEALVVGSPHGGSWLLGYQRPDSHYASFSIETISFEFSGVIDAFGISLSQGNRNQGPARPSPSRPQRLKLIRGPGKNGLPGHRSCRLSGGPGAALTSPPGAARVAQAARGKCDGIGPTRVPV
jgi:hypothetical protein